MWGREVFCSPSRVFILSAVLMSSRVLCSRAFAPVLRCVHTCVVQSFISSNFHHGFSKSFHLQDLTCCCFASSLHRSRLCYCIGASGFWAGEGSSLDEAVRRQDEGCAPDPGWLPQVSHRHAGRVRPCNCALSSWGETEQFMKFRSLECFQIIVSVIHLFSSGVVASSARLLAMCFCQCGAVGHALAFAFRGATDQYSKHLAGLKEAFGQLALLSVM